MQSSRPQETETQILHEESQVFVRPKRSNAESISVLARLLDRSMKQTEKIWAELRRDIHHPDHQARLVISLRRSDKLSSAMNRIIAKTNLQNQ